MNSDKVDVVFQGGNRYGITRHKMSYDFLN